jgi:hypothetical protein
MMFIAFFWTLVLSSTGVFWVGLLSWNVSWMLIGLLCILMFILAGSILLEESDERR